MPCNLDSLYLRLDEFEGPLSLLLHLIERRELEISRVSVTAVADQFLSLVAGAGTTDLAITGQFVAAAARLLLIKSRALIFQPDAPDVNDVSDDADVLAYQVTEYRRFRVAAHALGEALDSNRQTSPRPVDFDASASARLLPHLRPETLRRAVLRLLEYQPSTHANPGGWPDVRYPNIRDTLLAEVLRLRRTNFEALCTSAWHPLVIVTMFLAVLDTVRSGHIIMNQREPFGTINLIAPKIRARDAN